MKWRGNSLCGGGALSGNIYGPAGPELWQILGLTVAVAGGYGAAAGGIELRLGPGGGRRPGQSETY